MSSPITTKLSNNCFYFFCKNRISVINAAIEQAAAPTASSISSLLCPKTTKYSPINHIIHPINAINSAIKLNIL
jgi:hypothetical protein